MDIKRIENKSNYIPLSELEIYKLAHELSNIGWKIYEALGNKEKNIMGDQFIRSTDSTGANIAEGYSRFHYLDRIKFCYNSRGSLMEASSHWLELLKERELIQKEDYDSYSFVAKKLSLKLNNYIKSLYTAKSRNQNKYQSIS